MNEYVYFQAGELWKKINYTVMVTWVLTMNQENDKSLDSNH